MASNGYTNAVNGHSGVQFEHTSMKDVDKIHAELTESFDTGIMYPLEKRKHELAGMARMLSENADRWKEAITADVHKPDFQALLHEISIVHAAISAINDLDEWAKPLVPTVSDRYHSYKPVLYKVPKGVILLITPWNYPIALTLGNVISALAAGNCVVVKPSELAPTVSALMAELGPKYLDSKVVRFINGGVKETTRLLELKFAHIFYTGNGAVGRIVAAAAAKSLTPVTLELGGKSPVVVDPENFDPLLVARRILWGKLNNAGQTCVSPDYILCPESIQPALLEAMGQAMKEFFPDTNGVAFKHKDFGRIVNERHFQRVQSLIDRSHGEVVFGEKKSDPATYSVAPLVIKTDGNDSLMGEELFAPVFPLISVKDVDDAIKFINSRDHPLALYVFTQSPEVKQKFIARTRSGSLVFNDTWEQLSVEVPLGGFGESGYGQSVGRFGFDQFTHFRPSIDVPMEAEESLWLRYPPYTPAKMAIANKVAKPKNIPDI
ncbi:aldehyde dehydrogenase [Calocera viscosa TUFC12733]|uniref:Aldehyde dehydrogenase n=1 Tax=Calocera viscosa (strain TUFC12733) TaxID=1330018 RepID=A0A167J594_CALVF|nr:aldehyde dehydrogenase [Calocera viscosa TUFC12733]